MWQDESKGVAEWGVGWGEEGRKARKRILAFEKSVCPQITLLIGAA